jgi:ElaB/YqjD/DUF883 family membrane-anchored ribosome-binding protein
MDQATEFESKTDKMQRHLVEAGSAAKDVAREKLDQVRDTASDYYEQGMEKAKQVNDSTVEFIKEQPFTSMMIAAGLGLLAGLFISRR